MILVNFIYQFPLLLFLLTISITSLAASFGNLLEDSVQSSATICFSVGAQAGISGLDDFELQALDGDGSAGAIYEGFDVFHLESNSPVRVLISEGQLSNDEDIISTLYSIDGSENVFNTSESGSHVGDHTLEARAQLTRISNQRAGDYSGIVILTIVPQIGEGGGCGESVNTFSSSDGWVTLAYEDLYPSAGDADYNDMVIRYHVAENYNAQQELESVRLQFVPLARGAGYNHSFHLSLDGELDSSNNISTITAPSFIGEAAVEVTYSHENGNSRVFSYKKEKDITIFHNTRATLTGFANVYQGQEWLDAKFTTEVNITLAQPELNLLADRGVDSELLFRPFLHVKNTNSDIDLININSADGMLDQNGAPFGIIVPDHWEWPLERVDINVAYPYFAEYQSWLNGDILTLSEEAKYWYRYPASSGLIYTGFK